MRPSCCTIAAPRSPLCAASSRRSNATFKKPAKNVWRWSRPSCARRWRRNTIPTSHACWPAIATGGQWTDGTGGVSPSHHQGVRYAGTAVEIDASALTGIDNIDETTKRLAKILARSVDEVGHVPGAARYGTAVHVAFEFNVFFEGIRGIGPGDIEPSFSLPPGYPSAKTTVRPDVVLRNDIGDIIAIYDVKTGDEGLDRARRAEFRAATGVDRTVPIIELRVCNDPIDCTYAK